ncbi:hypothetical protein LCGC14_0686550 [marine sediment metagenome]|uniref:Uncharacterized protein n=1 Tax=marine sediment metagenome TaxID=412755 RepID=A0A0F9TUL9_9ZZZZ
MSYLMTAQEKTAFDELRALHTKILALHTMVKEDKASPNIGMALLSTGTDICILISDLALGKYAPDKRDLPDLPF